VNLVDQIIDYVIKHVGWDALSDAGFRDQETLKQYISFQLIHQNLMYVLDPETEAVTGVLISYECDEDEAYARFEWTVPNGKKCIFVAQVASSDSDSLKLLAHGFLLRFKDKKTTVCVRRGTYTTMKAHDIAKRLLTQTEASL
jgi:hypothetical protein